MMQFRATQCAGPCARARDQQRLAAKEGVEERGALHDGAGAMEDETFPMQRSCGAEPRALPHHGLYNFLVDRERARCAGDFVAGDLIRKRLRSLGIEIDDKERRWRSQDGRSGVRPGASAKHLQPGQAAPEPTPAGSPPAASADVAPALAPLAVRQGLWSSSWSPQPDRPSAECCAGPVVSCAALGLVVEG